MKNLLILLFPLSVFMPVITGKTGLSEKYPFGMKMLCSFMFLLVGIVSVFAVQKATFYSVLILSALFFGFLGDFFLSYKYEKYFLLGVIFFAIGHMIYGFTFLFEGENNAFPYIVPILVITAFVTLILFFFSKTKLELKNRQTPLLIYAAILFLSFACAIVKGIVSLKINNLFFGLCLISGGTLFLISDLVLGMNMGGMKLPKMFRHAVSYTYFPSQTLFALSIVFRL